MPSAADVVRCERCHARILWTVTAAGNHQAVDADPDDTGNVAVYTDVTGRYRSRAITKDRPSLEGSEWQAMPHAATCSSPPPRQPRRTTTRRPARRAGAWRWTR